MALDAVTLDDIVQLPRLTFFRNILIKMDVEGHEHRVLLGAKKFMKKKLKYIKGIIMEWQWFSGRQDM
jgi:FkbM family methyltransferase